MLSCAMEFIVDLERATSSPGHIDFALVSRL